MPTTRDAMRGVGLLVVVMAMGLGACGGDPLAGPGPDNTVVADAGAPASADAGAACVSAGGARTTVTIAGSESSCSPLCPGDVLTDGAGKPVVNALCDRICGSPTVATFCMTASGSSLFCGACAAPPAPACAEVVTSYDDCTGSPGPLCCNKCETGDHAGRVSDCIANTNTGSPTLSTQVVEIRCGSATAPCR